MLSTTRAIGQAPVLADRAAAVVEVPAGPVDQVAGGLLGGVDGVHLVALGGGRVIDVAKAIAAATAPPRSLVAIPTTLSGAEMTGVHRRARGAAAGAAGVRPSVVLNDPALSASAPVAGLAASSANALGHAAVAMASRGRSPLAAAVGEDAARRLAAGWAEAEPDREQLALGALLAGWAVDQSGLGLHHVMTQSLVRATGIPHAQANAILLPATVAAIARRAPEVRRLGELAGRLRDRSGLDGIPAAFAGPDALERAVELAAGRPELDRLPPRPTIDELRAVYGAARTA